VNDAAPAWSPDGRKIAFQTRRDGNFEVYVMNADGSNPVRITEQSDFDGFPDWYP
jgi:TolB protein